MDPWLLWSRALVLGLLATGLGAAGHVTADGVLPGAATLTTLTVVMVALSALLLLRPASRLRLVLMLAGGQAAVHLVLTSTAGHTGMGPGHEAHLTATDASMWSSWSTLAHQMTSHVVGHGPMMAAHLTVAALLGLWLARGESALWTLIALATRHVVASVAALAVVEVRPRGLTTPSPCPVGPRSPWQARPHTRRGPPLAAVS